jgi:prepilin-type N-terminal cleavage/methylation domain-containing protein
MRIFGNKGFTLIELIISIGILGILAVAALLALNPFAQFQKANDTRRKSDLAQVQRALESYYQDHGAYPAFIKSSGGFYYLNPLTGTPPTTTQKAWGSAWTPYLNVIPSDPNSTKSYAYYTTLDGQTYYIYASLDRGSNDPAVCSGNLCTAPVDSNIDMNAACGSGKCDFGVSSPNVTP